MILVLSEIWIEFMFHVPLKYELNSCSMYPWNMNWIHVPCTPEIWIEFMFHVPLKYELNSCSMYPWNMNWIHVPCTPEIWILCMFLVPPKYACSLFSWNMNFIHVPCTPTGLKCTRFPFVYALVWFWKHSVAAAVRTSNPWTARWRRWKNSPNSPTHSRVRERYVTYHSWPYLVE